MVRTAVILAAGKPINIDMPSCLLPVPDENILTSMLNALENMGLTKIIVVTGFQNELIKKSFSTRKIIWIDNPDYMYSGTMHSLSLVSSSINEDFLLLESDLVIPLHMIQAIAEDPAPNVTVTSNLTGSGDETFVEVNTDSYLIALSKDIRQLNAIHTEMIGITKISHPLFSAMLDKYASTNNLWLNYEYVMIQLQDRYPIRCLGFDNTPWIDIDDDSSYCKARDHVIYAIRTFEENLCIVRDNVETAIADRIKYITQAGGMTNDNYKVITTESTYFVRLPGPGTDSMINRTYEPHNTKMIESLKIDAPIILIDSSNGIKITEYIPNSITFSKRTARLPQHLKKVAALLQILHQSHAVFINHFDFLTVLEQYLDQLRQPISYPDFQESMNNVKHIHQWLLSGFDYCEAPCHNDLVPENFILDEHSNLFLIDWEYSGINDYYWDLASYLLETEATKEEEKIFLTYYLNRLPNEQDLIKIKIYQAFQDILWAVWALVKKEKNENSFVLYGTNRYERGSKTLRELIKYGSSEVLY